jgi:hypothetical protein
VAQKSIPKATAENRFAEFIEKLGAKTCKTEYCAVTSPKKRKMPYAPDLDLDE